MTDTRWRTIIEPFRIHSVEPMRVTTREERAPKLAEARHNLFRLRAEDVLIDLLTDSGTGAMSSEQWAGIQRGNEAYAGAPSYYRFVDAVTELFPFRHVLPTHQGRAAEKILFSVIAGPGKVIPDDCLRYRIRSVEYLGNALEQAGVPVVVPFGGHAVFIDARALLPHIPPLQYPGQALACALYVEGGIRACEIGTVMFGRHADGSESPAPMDLVRLAIPRRTYTQSHIDYVIEVVRWVADRGATLHGMRIVSQPPQLRHFTAEFEPLG